MKFTLYNHKLEKRSIVANSLTHAKRIASTWARQGDIWIRDESQEIVARKRWGEWYSQLPLYHSGIVRID